nr:GNAT family N-acetyltransferase [uncultured Roseateles sp.]
MIVSQTERLTVRLLERGDAAFMLQLVNEPAFIQNIGDREVRDLAQAQAYTERSGPLSYERLGFGMYLVALKSSGERLGICGLISREGLSDVDIGYAFLQAHWGQGYALEAARAVLGHAHRALGLRRVLAITAPENQPSVRLLEQLGMQEQGLVDLPKSGGISRLFVSEAD